MLDTPARAILNGTGHFGGRTTVRVMTRDEIRQLFGTSGPAVTPVIHALDSPQVDRNIDRARKGGAAGVFLINHDFVVDAFLPIVRAARATHPDLWLGVNFLAVTGRDAFPVLGRLEAEGCRIDAYWADDARIDERRDDQAEAGEIDRIRRDSGWTGLYFGGTAFKKQRPVDPADYGLSARIAVGHMDVVTTSGVATGEEASTDKIAAFRSGAGDAALALASGITPENAATYAEIDCFLVATGIAPKGDFYNIDPARLDALMAVTREMGVG